MAKKTIAVLMSTYNGEKYVKCQIDSILGQDLDDAELDLIIRDDGSKDDTINIIKRYIENGERVYLHCGSNIGYIGSFISLLDLMKTDYRKYDFYALADQDDRWDNDKIQIGIDSIENENAGVPVLYQSYSRIVDENLSFLRYPKEPRRPVVFYNTMVQIIAAGHTYVFNHALMDIIKTDVDYSNLFGHDAYITNVAAIAGKIVFDKSCHTDYRQHSSNQLGTSSNSVIAWTRNRVKRTLNGGVKLYGKQIRYIYELYKDSMDDREEKETNLFIDSQRSFLTRLGYITKTQFYRQWKLDNISFRLLYLFGGYNL